jgi:hypothetical protein
VTVVPGYNLITAFPYQYVKNGWMLGINPLNSVIALNTLGDASISDIVQTGCVFVNATINVTANVALYARVLVSRPVNASLLYMYPKASLNTNITAMVVSPVTLNSSTTISIYEQITNVTISFANPTSCFTTAVCSFNVTWSTGTWIRFIWNIWNNGTLYNQTLNTSVSVASLTLPKNGIYTVSVYAYNSVSNFTSNSTQFFVQYPLNALQFFAANPFNQSQSASPLNAVANFSFVLGGGTDYNCLIDFGK